MSELYCQSCGMPLSKEEEYGTNADGSKNSEYCIYCYTDGAFTLDGTMEDMARSCAGFLVESKEAATQEEAYTMMMDCLPGLKRWKK